MRATSLPTAHPIAAAALVLVAAALALLAVPSSASAGRWLRPVPGEVARGFSYDRAAPFTAGAHRGVDLAAPPGATVRAACAGRVVHAGAVAGRDAVVSVRCAARRVSYLPLASVAVRAGATIRAGEPIGTVARGHGGLHLGVRAEGDPFGYEDPMALLPAPDEPLAPAPRPSTPLPAVHPGRPKAAPLPVIPRRAAWPATSPPLAGRVHSSPAPWPVWLGLAALMAGAAGSGTIAVRRRLARSCGQAAPAAQLR